MFVAKQPSAVDQGFFKQHPLATSLTFWRSTSLASQSTRPSLGVSCTPRPRNHLPRWRGWEAYSVRSSSRLLPQGLLTSRPSLEPLTQHRPGSGSPVLSYSVLQLAGPPVLPSTHINKTRLGPILAGPISALLTSSAREQLVYTPSRRQLATLRYDSLRASVPDSRRGRVLSPIVCAEVCGCGFVGLGSAHSCGSEIVGQHRPGVVPEATPSIATFCLAWRRML